MKLLPVVLFASIALVSAAYPAGRAHTSYPAMYAGGSLPLNHNKVHAALGKDAVIFQQGNTRIAVPVKDITGISCGEEAHGYYIGVSWAGSSASTSGAQALLKLSRAEYRDFLAALEQSTGIKAVNTNQVPTVVRYAI